MANIIQTALQGIKRAALAFVTMKTKQWQYEGLIYRPRRDDSGQVVNACFVKEDVDCHDAFGGGVEPVFHAGPPTRTYIGKDLFESYAKRFLATGNANA